MKAPILFHLGAMARMRLAPTYAGLVVNVAVNIRVWRPAPVDNVFAAMLVAIEERRR